MGILKYARRYVDGLEWDSKPFFGIVRENVPVDTLMGPVFPISQSRMGIRENARRYVDGLERDPMPFFGIVCENVPVDTLMGPVWSDFLVQNGHP